MTFDMIFFLFAVPAVIFAGMSKGGFGSAASFAATPLLALILTPGQAIGVMLPLLMLMDVTAVRVYWRKWHWSSAKVLVLGAIPGILIGWLIYGRADPDIFKLLIGVIAIGFVLFQLARERGVISPAKRPIGPKLGGFWGAVLGFTSFVSHAGGPPAMIYLLSQKLDKTTFQATTVLVFWSVNLLKLPTYVAAEIFTKETIKADLMLAPFAVLGVFIGVWLHHKVDDKLFFLLTYCFLTLTGAKLIFDAVS